MKKIIAILTLALTLSGCAGKPDAAALINIDEMKRVTMTLSSDEYMGRMPFTMGVLI